MADDDIPTDGPGGPDDGDDPTQTAFGAIEPIEIQEEMERSFLDYAMSVIVQRALPDVRDGLKPVHRRILWGMYDLGARPDRPHMKCARVTGEVMGKYHPHGDDAIYDALVRMAQDLSLRHPLVHAHGNFGSPDYRRPPPATPSAGSPRWPCTMLDGIDENTVDFVDNYAGEFQQPDVLPSRFPNLLVNGSQGIAVGMATNIPPHNLGEVIDATMHLIDNPEATSDDLMQFVKGPDFPTGGLIMGRAGIIDAYRTGRGSIRMRAVAEIEEAQRGGDKIVITELPYQVGPNAVLAKIKELVGHQGDRGHRRRQRRVGGRRHPHRDQAQARRAGARHPQQPLQAHAAADDLRGEHGGAGRRRAAHAEPARGLHHYIEHQVEVITRRSEFRLDKARKRAHIVEGLLKALDMIDEIIAAIRASDDKAAARAALMAEPFEFSEVQAEHILDMQLHRLTRLGRANLEEEMEELQRTIAELEAILADRSVLLTVIKDELGEIREKFADERRSKITFDVGDIDIEDLIDDEDLVVTMSAKGYVKTVSADAFRTPGPRRSRRRRRQAARRGLRRPHPPHHRARLPAVLLEPRAGVPAQGARDPDEGAHGAGHRRS